MEIVSLNIICLLLIFSADKVFCNFAQNKAASLSGSIQNFTMIWDMEWILWTYDISLYSSYPTYMYQNSQYLRYLLKQRILRRISADYPGSHYMTQCWRTPVTPHWRHHRRPSFDAFYPIEYTQSFAMLCFCCDRIRITDFNKIVFPNQSLIQLNAF